MRRKLEPDETVSEAIIHAVSVQTGQDPLALGRFGSVVDPDAIDALFGGSPDDGVQSLTLVYEGCRVTVDDDVVTVVDGP